MELDIGIENRVSLLKTLFRLKLLGINSIPKNKITLCDVRVTHENLCCDNCAFYINPPKCDKKIVVVGDCRFDDSPIGICSKEEVDLLKKMLESINLKFDEIYFTSAIKCSNAGANLHRCKEIIKSEFSLNDAYYILSFGSLLYTLLFDEKKDILQIRKKVHTHGNKAIVFTFKPADILGAKENQQKELKKLVWEDLRLFKSLLN